MAVGLLPESTVEIVLKVTVACFGEKMQRVAAKITQPPLTFLSDPILLRSMAPRSYSSHTSVVGSV